MNDSINELITRLQKEQVATWFDLGLFLDRLKDRPPRAGFNGDYYAFKEKIVRGGIGFLSFVYSIDGITIEVSKYTAAMRQLFPGVPIHLLAGEITSESANVLDPQLQRHVIPEIKSFDKWELYQDFFRTKLERGSKEYNALIAKFWDETLLLTEKLARQIQENKITLLYLLNICSNPGNISLALASVLVSEYWGIPVINNNHDFYWEGGNKQIDIETKGLEKGPRDFFFTNADVGEIFSTLEVLFPWESRSWMTVNINENQVRHVINVNGHNPANVALLGTVVNSSAFEPISKRESLNTMAQIGSIFENRAHKTDHILQHKTQYINRPFLCGFEEYAEFDFCANNLLLLQPTRIISRKRIEVNFKLIEKLIQQPDFVSKFKENPLLKISIVITGPIPTGQRDYFYRLLEKFAGFLKKLPETFRNKIFLGFLFSAFDTKDYKDLHKKPFGVTDLYKAASLILLPSESEGRGLPLIEAAAAGKPVFCRRYEPEQVYAEVIGEHLDESQRLRVLEFRKDIPETLVRKTIQRLFYPQDAAEDVIHNIEVIGSRYNLESLKNTLETIVYKLYLQLHSITHPNPKIRDYFREYDQYINFTNDDLEAVINTKTREYLPGYGRLAYMLLLKSLIDPSYFRVEEQNVRGEVHHYALSLLETYRKNSEIPIEKCHRFFNAVEDLFRCYKGEIETRHDHSFAYRHRNKRYYPYRNYTFQELTGLVNTIFEDIIDPPKPDIRNVPTQFFFTDWNLALVQLTTSHELGIDNRAKLFQKLKQKVPRGYFPGQYVRYEMEFFILQPIRAILGLEIEEELTKEILNKNIKTLPKVYIFAHKSHLFSQASAAGIRHYLESTLDKELHILYKSHVVELIRTPQSCIGFHLRQMGFKGLKVLREIKQRKGFIITNGQSAAMMTDILDIDRFHIGKVKRALTGKIMGIPMNSGFVQYVPAGVRTTLAYPTPVQTSKDFDEAIKSRAFKRLAAKLGEEKLFALMRADAETHGTPVKAFLKNLEKSKTAGKSKADIAHSFVGGVYADGMPWSGVLAEVKTGKHWRFSTHTAKRNPRPVTELIKEYFRASGKKAQIAWNGGYILNPELVGKLGLPETYIGSPLGLLMVNKEVKCPPLFNKPAFLIMKDGRLDIRRVNSRSGFVVSSSAGRLEFNGKEYNRHSVHTPCYYDLTYASAEIIGDGNVLVRLAGHRVKEIIHTQKGQSVPVIPVGLTLSIPPKLFSETLFKEEQPLSITLKNGAIDWSEVAHAVEAGPMLIKEGRQSIEMDLEGWTTDSSIKTQAARMDFTDMRGPKIAAGLTKDGRLLILAINGRIRESVGATHIDMADILLSYGAEKAMGFDPGGSSTLVVNGKTLNISPYNKEYERDIYSLPPEPRFVANAVLGWRE